MKHIALLFLSISLSIQCLISANLKAGDEVKIQEAKAGDYYVGAGEIVLSTKIDGDFIASGGEIDIQDSILGDLLSAGGRINVNGPVLDDIRVSGGEITIDHYVGGDVIVFGGTVRITEDASIGGDLICFAGEVSIFGPVSGNLMVYGGTVRLRSSVGGEAEIKTGVFDFDGSVSGNMVIQSKSIELGSEANCSGSIRYWQNDGELNFEGICDDVNFDEDLAYVEKDVDWSVLTTIFGIGLVAYWIIFILATLLVLLLLEFFVSNYFEKVAQQLRSNFVTSFGYGMLYLLGMPILILISFVIIIGFPIGLLALSLYGLSFLFAIAAIGLVVSHYFRSKSKQDWSKIQIIGYAMISIIALKIIFMIPLLGAMLKTVAMAAVYGALIKVYFIKRNEASS